jgi:hypothetical protein
MAVGAGLNAVYAKVPQGARVTGFKEYTVKRLKKRAEALGLPTVVHGDGGLRARKQDYVRALSLHMRDRDPWLDMTHF